MSTKEGRDFSAVSGIIEEDFEFLTDLRCSNIQILPGQSPNKAQAIRRLYIRMLISAIEEAIATIKAEALKYSNKLSQGELVVLAEITYDVSDRGNVVERQMHTSLPNSFRFAFQTLAKAWGVNTMLDYSDEGWEALQHTVKLRNRLTHPKNAKEFQVSDEDMHQADVAEAWFRRAHGAMMKEHIVHLNAKFKNLSNALKPEVE